MSLDTVLRVGTKLILPFVALFAIYVQFHGDFGPGGGFQAGVLLAGCVFLISIVFGLDTAKRVAPPAVVTAMVPLGALIYAGTGVVSLLLGANYLDYSPFAHEPVHGHHLGIMSVELGVLITVAGTMMALFYAFVERDRQ